MNYRVEVSPEVQEQIDEQVAYLRSEQVSETILVGWLMSLSDAMLSLREHPLRFPVDAIRTQIRGYEIRRMSVGEFVVFYRVMGELGLVQVLTIRHGKRRPWLEGGAG